MAPLVPVLIALAAGIVIDREADPLETSAWITLMLGSITVACLGLHDEIASSLGVLLAVLALGGGWHHFWWNDRLLDDLSESVTERPRPVWVRGVVTEQMGLRTSAELRPRRSGPRGDPDGSGAHRDLRRHAVAHGLRSRQPDRRRRSDRRARGRTGRGGGAARADLRAAQPRRVRSPGVSSSPGNPPAARRGQSIGTVSRPAGNPLAMDAMAGRPPRLESRAACGPARPAHRAAGGGLDPRSARGHRSGDQRRLRADRYDSPAGHLGFAAPGAGPVLESALPLRPRSPSPGLSRRRTRDPGLFGARRLCRLGGSFRRHDAGLLPGRRRQPARPAGQYPGDGGAGDAGLEPVLPLRCRLPALLPGHRRLDLAGAQGAARRPRPGRIHRVRGTEDSAADRRAGAAIRARVAATPAADRRRNRSGYHRLGSRLAGCPSAGGPAIPSRLADRSSSEHPPDSADLDWRSFWEPPGSASACSGLRWASCPSGPRTSSCRSPRRSCAGALPRAGDIGSWPVPPRAGSLPFTGSGAGRGRRVGRNARAGEDAPATVAGGSLVCRGSFHGPWLAVRSLRALRVHDRRRPACRRAWSGGRSSPGRRPYAPVRLRSHGRSASRASDHRPGALEPGHHQAGPGLSSATPTRTITTRFPTCWIGSGSARW